MISRMPASAAPTMGDRRSELSRNSPPFNTEMTDSRFTQSPALRYITRSEPGRYWRVQYARSFPKPIQVYFGDATYGGRDAALVEAQKFRDQIVARHQPHLSAVAVGLSSRTATRRPFAWPASSVTR